FDFDRPDDEQKLVVEGNYDNLSRYVRVEVSDEVNENKLPKSALPVGFRGMAHLVTSGSAPLAALGGADVTALSTSTFLRNAIIPPIPLSDNIRILNNNVAEPSTVRRWGVKLDHIIDLTQHNKDTALFNKSINSFVKHFPNHSVNNVNFSVSDNTGTPDTAQLGIVDADRFNNNLFTLENIQDK
ncbi:hypothetical protein EBS02_05965, partial [bacterium]|nr:hypothetical protein [bacterium]